MGEFDTQYNLFKAFFDSIFEKIGFIIEKVFFSIFRFAKKHKVSRFGRNDMGIIFAFPKEISRDNPLANDVLKKEEIRQLNLLFDDLKNKISRYGIKMNRVDNKYIPTTQEEARLLLKTSRASLIIWGNVKSGNTKFYDNSVTDIHELNFTYAPKTSTANKKLLGETLAFSLLGKNRIIDHKNDMDDRDVMARNIKNSSCYTIAMVLALNNKFKIAHDLFDGLESEIARQNFQNGQGQNFLKIVKRMNAYTYLAESHYIKIPAVPSDKKKEEVIRLTNLAEKKCKDVGDLEMNKAIICFWDRNIDLAIEYLRKVPASCGSDFSNAFLFYYKKEIKNGWKSLRKAVKGFKKLRELEVSKEDKKNNDILIKGIIKFYKDVIKIEPDNYLLLFPLSYIIYHVIGKKKANKYAKKLLLNADNINFDEEKKKNIFKKRAQRIMDLIE